MLTSELRQGSYKPPPYKSIVVFPPLVMSNLTEIFYENFIEIILMSITWCHQIANLNRVFFHQHLKIVDDIFHHFKQLILINSGDTKASRLDIQAEDCI